MDVGLFYYAISPPHLYMFFFLYQQFITRLAEEDRGSYFRNYVQSKQTNMKLEKGKGKEKEKEKGKIRMK